MIYFGFENYSKSSDGTQRIESSYQAKDLNLSYCWNFWFPYLGAVDQSRYNLCKASDLINKEIKFIFPIELRYEFIEYLSESDSSCFFLDPYIPEIVFEGLRQKKVVLVISFAHEARPFYYETKKEKKQKSVYDEIAKFVIRHNLSQKAVWVLTANVYFQKELNEWIHKNKYSYPPFQIRYANIFCPLLKGIRQSGIQGISHKIKGKVHVKNGGLFFESTTIIASSIADSISDFYKNAESFQKSDSLDKLFLCLNNVPRKHRILTLVEMALGGHLKNSLVSLNMENPDEIKFENPRLQKGWEIVKEKMPLRVDKAPLVDASLNFNKVEEFDNSPMMGIYDDIPYRRCKFNIVTETNCENEICFISEKTWKAIIACRPFVVVGNPLTLKYLRRQGYLTFNDFFDESYDEIHQIEEKIEKIGVLLNEIAKIDYKKHEQKFKTICSHNLYHFESSINEFEKVMLEIKSAF